MLDFVRCKIVYLCLLIFFKETAHCQLSGIINNYSKVTSINTTCNFVTVNTTSGFNVGDNGILIQMKGATIDANGNVTNYGSAGIFELVTISDIQSNDIYFTNTILNSYNPAMLVQLVSLPVYSDVIVSGTLTAKAWDGNTGGILALEVSDTLRLNSNIDVSGLGFRGGRPNLNGGSGCSASVTYTFNTNVTAAGKGESIYIPSANQENGRGRIANGGGGGLVQNTGGGGGGNAGNGGNGGSQSSGCGTILPSYPGIGGSGLASTNKVFLGGGGGAGQQNNFTGGGPPTQAGSTPGGNGGGLLLLKAGTLVSNGNQILAFGAISNNSPAFGDGAGGGGAGGSVLLDITNYSDNMTINVSGGKGDNVFMDSPGNIGPGGGGGGGFIQVSQSVVNGNITNIINGGAAGIVYGHSSNCNCNHNATSGTAGTILTNLILPKSSTISNCALPANLISIDIRESQNDVILDWKVANEYNVKSYIILNSTNNKDYDTIANISGINNPNLQSYSFKHSTFQIEEYSYYRLIQIEMDGRYNILATKAIFRNEQTPAFSISPNPVHEFISIKSSINDAYIVTISDLSGKVLYNYNLYGYINQLDISNLCTGFYNILIETDENRKIFKLIKN